MNSMWFGAALIAVGVLLFGLLGRSLFNRARGWGFRAFALIVLLPPAGLALLSGLMRVSAANGLPPSPEQRTLYRGVSYERRVALAPDPQVTHIVRVELEAKGISLLVTPGDAAKLLPVAAKTASEQLEEHKLEIGIVGGTFAPGYQSSPWAEPLPAGSFVKPSGRTVSRGVEYGKGDGPASLYFTDHNDARIGDAPSSVYNAITGDCVLTGVDAAPAGCPLANERTARAAVGLDASKQRLTLVVVDGHRDGVAPGVTADELAALLTELEVVHSIHLGVGPQAELVVRGEDGTIAPLSVPMGLGRAGSERRVGAMLGVQAISRLE